MGAFPCSVVRAVLAAAVCARGKSLQEPIENTQWRVVAVALVAAMVAASHIGKMPAAVPEIRADLGLGMVAAGWAVSMFNALGAVVGVMIGVVADSAGHRRFAMFGLSCQIIGSLVSVFSWSPTLLLIGRAIEGIGFMAVVVAVPGIIGRVTVAKDRRFAFGILAVYMPTGAALGLSLSPFVMAASGWRALWLISGAASLLALLLLRAMTVQHDRTPGWLSLRLLGNAGQDLTRVLVRPGLWWLATAFGAYTLQWSSLMVWLPTFLLESRQFPPLVAAEVTALVVFANVPGILVGVWLAQRGAPRWCLVAGANLVMGACAFAIFSDQLGDAARFAASLVFSASGGLLPPAVLGGAAVHAPSPRLIAAANGMTLQGSNLGQFLGPVAIGAAVAATGDWTASIAVMVAAACLGTAAGIAAEFAERKLK